MIRGVVLTEADIWVDREREIRKGPQVGRQFETDWDTFRGWLSRPKEGDFKDAHGAWICGDLPGGIVAENTGPVYVFPGDVDKGCGPDGMAATAAALAAFDGVVVPTFSWRPDDARHRFVVLPDRPIEPDEFLSVWLVIERILARKGVKIDGNCKNINRLYYPPVVRPGAGWPGVMSLTGTPFSVDWHLEEERAHQENQRRVAAMRYQRVTPLTTREENRKLDAMIRNGCSAVSAAGEGDRHLTLVKKSVSLAREGMRPDQIEDALLDAFVCAAGERRRKEGQQIIAWAVRH